MSLIWGTLDGYRDKTMLELLYATGMRVSELVNVPVKNVDMKMQYVIVMGKGSKERMLPLGRTALHYLEHYLSVVRPQLLHGKPDTAAELFCNRLGRADDKGAFLRNYCGIRQERRYQQARYTAYAASFLCDASFK